MAVQQSSIQLKAPVEYGTPGRVKGGLAKWILVAFMILLEAMTGILIFRGAIFDFSLDPYNYSYFALALTVPCVLLNIPLMKKKGKDKIPWYDWALGILAIGIFIFFGANHWNIQYGAWASYAPWYAVGPAIIAVLMMLFIAYRVYGPIFAGICVIFTIFPMVADKAPGILFGIAIPFRMAMAQFAMGGEGINGIPMQVAAKLVLGFMMFIISMLYLGGGRTLIDLAFSLIGRFRGGGAKAAVLGSAVFASISGGPSTNAITTGSVTIPAMKKTGYPPHYAAAIESCASMGGTLTPPVMGSVAFIMASFLQMDYWKVAVAAAIPALLFYISLFAQVDLYAKKADLRGLTKEELPSFWGTLKDGWIFPASLIFFAYALVGLHMSAEAGFFSAALLLGLYFVVDPLIKTLLSRSPDRWQSWVRRLKGIPNDLANIFLSIGKVTASIVTLFGVIGLIIAGLTLPGVALALSGGIINLAGSNMWLILLFGAI
ncbi:TRAP transporter permease, partial [Chloroflexota bacterium]